MKKDDEIDFWRAIRQYEYVRNSGVAIPYTRTIADELGIPPARAYYLLNKWSRKGYWEWGVNPFGGWLTEKGLNTVFTQHDEISRGDEYDDFAPVYHD